MPPPARAVSRDQRELMIAANNSSLDCWRLSRLAVRAACAVLTNSGNFTGRRWLVSSGITGTHGWRVFVLEPSARVFSLWEHEKPTASARCKTTAMTAAHSSVLAANLAGSSPTTASGPGARTYRSELRLVIGYRLVAPRLLPIEAARLHKTSTRSLELTVPSVEILAR